MAEKCWVHSYKRINESVCLFVCQLYAQVVIGVQCSYFYILGIIFSMLHGQVGVNSYQIFNTFYKDGSWSSAKSHRFLHPTDSAILMVVKTKP